MLSVTFQLGERRRQILIGALIAFTVSCCSWAAMTSPLGGDYPGPACRTCDFAGPPIEALAAGHVGTFFSSQPVMGSVSLLLRAPIVAVARPLGADELLQYRLGCLVCLLVAAGLAWMLVRFMRPRGAQWVLVALMLWLLLAGPVTTRALAWGHPEELLGAMLCVAAVVLARRGQASVAGIALGLAIATKQWGLLALLPALIACPRQRTRLLWVTAAVAAIFIVPMFLADPARFVSENLHTGVSPSSGSITGVTPTNIWFAYGRVGGEVVGPHGGASYEIPAALGTVSHLLIFLAGFGLPLIYWRSASRRSWHDVLLLLALVFLLRCLLDPLTYSYHHLPFLAAIVAYETLRGRGMPFISLYSAVAIWVLTKWVAPANSPATMNHLYLAWALPVVAYLAYKTFAVRTATSAGTEIQTVASTT